MSEWISVDDGIPEVGQAVIALGKPYVNRPETQIIAVIDYDGQWYEASDSFGWVEIDGDGFTAPGFNDIEGVTHWMPLPEPPKSK